MKTISCSICGEQDVPQNHSITINNQLYCNDCALKTYPEDSRPDDLNIVYNPDPTVCEFCGTDFGNSILPTLSQHPVCNQCAINMKRKAFPAWVKAFFFAVAGLALFSVVWNWRFYKAYVSFHEAGNAFEEQNFTKASALMANAHQHIPEFSEIEALSVYYNGISLMAQNKSAEALAEFNKCKDIMPGSSGIETLMLQAEMGAAFDSKNYPLFLQSSEKFAALNETESVSWASVASAYACLYATSNNDSFKRLAIENLNKAKDIDSISPEAIDYENRIEHRIATKEIITKEEFDKKFPADTRQDNR